MADGRHIWTVTPEAMVTSLKASSPVQPFATQLTPRQASFIGTLFYQLSLIFAKISICLLYIRVLLPFTYTRRAAFVLLAIVITYGILGAISTGTVCRPIAAFWDHTVKGECHPVAYMWAAIVLHVVTDFLIFLLPMPVVFRMRLPLAQRISLMLVFGLGFMYVLNSYFHVAGMHSDLF